MGWKGSEIDRGIKMSGESKGVDLPECDLIG